MRKPTYGVVAANNYVSSLLTLRRFKDVKSLLRNEMPVARRILGESKDITLRMRWNYAEALFRAGATLDDLREAVTTLEETDRIARRVYGGAHPLTKNIEGTLRKARAALRACEASAGSA